MYNIINNQKATEAPQATIYIYLKDPSGGKGKVSSPPNEVSLSIKKVFDPLNA